MLDLKLATGLQEPEGQASFCSQCTQHHLEGGLEETMQYWQVALALAMFVVVVAALLLLNQHLASSTWAAFDLLNWHCM